jgi:hypothetical protein
MRTLRARMHPHKQTKTMKKPLTIIGCAFVAQITAHAQDYDFRDSSNSPHIYSPDGEYLGNLNNNRYDPDSISNPYGAGSRYRANGVNNPYSPNYMPEFFEEENCR